MRLRNGGWPYSQPPTGVDFEINHYSEQAKGLVFWLPLFGTRIVGAHSYRDRILKRVLAEGGTPTWETDAMFGNALLFDDGATEYLETTSIPVSTVPVTLACWGNIDDLAVDSALVSVCDFSAASYVSLSIRATDLVSADARGTGGPSSATSSASASIDAWHHACAVFAAVDDKSAYLDGGSKGTDATSEAVSGWDTTLVGALAQFNGRTRYASGSIVDVRIYNRALSDSQVFALYDPSTRWELYRPIVPMFAGVTIPAPPAVMMILTTGGGYSLPVG